MCVVVCVVGGSVSSTYSSHSHHSRLQQIFSAYKQHWSERRVDVMLSVRAELCVMWLCDIVCGVVVCVLVLVCDVAV